MVSKFFALLLMALTVAVLCFLGPAAANSACPNCHGGQCYQNQIMAYGVPAVIDTPIPSIPEPPSESIVLANRVKPCPPPVVTPPLAPACGPNVQIPGACTPADNGNSCDADGGKRHPLLRIGKGLWNLRPGLIFRRR